MGQTTSSRVRSPTGPQRRNVRLPRESTHREVSPSSLSPVGRKRVRWLATLGVWTRRSLAFEVRFVTRPRQGVDRHRGRTWRAASNSGSPRPRHEPPRRAPPSVGVEDEGLGDLARCATSSGRNTSDVTPSCTIPAGPRRRTRSSLDRSPSPRAASAASRGAKRDRRCGARRRCRSARSRRAPPDGGCGQ